MPTLVLLGYRSPGKTTVAELYSDHRGTSYVCDLPGNPDRCIRQYRKSGTETVIDTPSFTGDNREDLQLAEDIRNTLSGVTGGIAIALVVNGQNPRFVRNEERILRTINSIFRRSDWVRNFCVIFTHIVTPPDRSQIPECQRLYLREVSEAIAGIVPNRAGRAIGFRQFFVRSCAREGSAPTPVEIVEISEFVRGCTQLKAEPRFEGSPFYHSQREKRICNVSERYENEQRIQVLQHQRREKQILFDGEILFTEWTPLGHTWERIVPHDFSGESSENPVLEEGPAPASEGFSSLRRLFQWLGICP
jgi:hypothetical protein